MIRALADHPGALPLERRRIEKGRLTPALFGSGRRPRGRVRPPARRAGRETESARPEPLGAGSPRAVSRSPSSTAPPDHRQGRRRPQDPGSGFFAPWLSHSDRTVGLLQSSGAQKICSCPSSPTTTGARPEAEKRRQEAHAERSRHQHAGTAGRSHRLRGDVLTQLGRIFPDGRRRARRRPPRSAAPQPPAEPAHRRDRLPARRSLGPRPATTSPQRRPTRPMVRRCGRSRPRHRVVAATVVTDRASAAAPVPRRPARRTRREAPSRWPSRRPGRRRTVRRARRSAAAHGSRTSGRLTGRAPGHHHRQHRGRGQLDPPQTREQRQPCSGDGGGPQTAAPRRPAAGARPPGSIRRRPDSGPQRHQQQRSGHQQQSHPRCAA